MGMASTAAIGAAEGMLLAGTSGRSDDFALSLRESEPDVLVEFTVPDAVEQNVMIALQQGVHVVSGTTGLPSKKAAELGTLAVQQERGFLLAPNFAIGVLLMQRFSREAVRWFPDVEILESHHDKKLDAPSGTALHTAELIAEAAAQAGSGEGLNSGRPSEHEAVAGVRGGRIEDIPVHSVRLPGLLAHQEVMFGGLGQLLTIRHDALDRAAFMPGVLLAVRKIAGYRGLIPSLEPFLDGPA